MKRQPLQGFGKSTKSFEAEMRMKDGQKNMDIQSPLPKNHPLMKAWEDYKKSEDFANTRKWALREEHVDGSLWAAFREGWSEANKFALK